MTKAHAHSFSNSRRRNDEFKTTQRNQRHREVAGILNPPSRESGSAPRRTQRAVHDGAIAGTGTKPDGPLLDLTEVAYDRCLEGRRKVAFSLPDERTAKVDKWWAGGFGDRLLGMVTALYLAVLTDSGFVVDWTWPYDIHDFFDMLECESSGPSLPDISLANSTAVHRNTLAEHLWSYFSDGSFVQDNGRDVILWSNARHWEHIVRHPSTSARAHELGLDKLSKNELFKLGVDSLFGHPSKELLDSHARLLREFSTRGRKPPAGRKGGGFFSSGTSASRPYMTSNVPRLSENPGARPIVGVQIRAGGVGEGWNDPERHPVSSASSCFAAEAARLCVEERACSIFLTADSRKAASLFEDEFKRLVKDIRGQRKEWSTGSLQREPPAVVIQTPGVIAHTDRSTLPKDEGAVSQAWFKSVLDWWTLKNADYLLISRSGFGETAAWASSARSVRRLQLAQALADSVGNAGDVNSIESKSSFSETRKGSDACTFDGAEDAFL